MGPADSEADRVSTLRPTMAGRMTTASRPTTATFDEFLSDEEGDSSDDGDDALQRMQEQAEDMEYMEFRLGSPNAHDRSFAPDDDVDLSFQGGDGPAFELSEYGGRATAVFQPGASAASSAAADASFADNQHSFLGYEDDPEEERQRRLREGVDDDEEAQPSFVAPAGAFDLAQHAPPPQEPAPVAQPVAQPPRASLPRSTAPRISMSPRVSTASSSSSMDDLSFVSFIGAPPSVDHSSSSSGTSFGSFDARERVADDSFMDHLASNSNEETQNSFHSRSSSGSYVDASFSSLIGDSEGPAGRPDLDSFASSMSGSFSSRIADEDENASLPPAAKPAETSAGPKEQDALEHIPALPVMVRSPAQAKPEVGKPLVAAASPVPSPVAHEDALPKPLTPIVRGPAFIKTASRGPRNILQPPVQARALAGSFVDVTSASTGARVSPPVSPVAPAPTPTPVALAPAPVPVPSPPSTPLLEPQSEPEYSYGEGSFSSSIAASEVYSADASMAAAHYIVQDPTEQIPSMEQSLASFEGPIMTDNLSIGSAATSIALLEAETSTAAPSVRPSMDELGAVRVTEDNLDFTGVFRGDNSRVKEPDATTSTEDPEPVFALPPTPLRRVTSDSVQRASERKVQDFFRRTNTYRFSDIDDDTRESEDIVTRSTRARTTVVYELYKEQDEELANSFAQATESPRRRRRSTSAMLAAESESIRPGVQLLQQLNLSIPPEPMDESLVLDSQRRTKLYDTRSRASSRLQINEDLLASPSLQMPLTPKKSAPPPIDESSWQRTEVSEEKPRPQSSTSSNSSQRSRTPDSPNMIPMPPNYMLSPDPVQTNLQSESLFAFSEASNPMMQSGTKFGQEKGLPSLSIDRTSMAPSPSLTSFFDASNSKGLSGTPGKVPGFKWNTQQQFGPSPVLTDEDRMVGSHSIWHEAAIQRPTISDQVTNHFHQLSSSLRNTLRRTNRLLGRSRQTTGGVTSPGSECHAPPRLPRAYDDRQFYAGADWDPTKVNKPKGLRKTSQRLMKKRKLRGIILLGCAIVGVAIGLGLIHASSWLATFNETSSEQEQNQTSRGELDLTRAMKWFLFPGKLFLRSWNCVTMPLLFCHVANAMVDLSLSAKSSSIVSFSSFWNLLMLSLVATLEGVGVMALAHKLGWFRPVTGSAVATTASTLEAAIGVGVRADGTAALMCESEESYLQVSTTGSTFRCSNSSIALPVYTGISSNGSIEGSSAAIFVIDSVKEMLHSQTEPSDAMYYPTGFPLSSLAQEIATTFVPNNAVDAFAHSTPLSIVGMALFVGVVCGKRAWQRSRVMNAEIGNQTRRLTRGPHERPHYLLTILVDLQLALEWLVDAIDFLAPFGVISVFAATIVLHWQEWYAVVTPMMRLVLVVLLLALAHMLLMMPMAVKYFFQTSTFTYRTMATFLPAFSFGFCTDSAVLTLPIAAQCFANAQTVTKSMAQVTMALASVVHRNGHALYFPLAILWLLETTTAAAGETLELEMSSYFSIALMTLVGCFLAAHDASIARLVKPKASISAGRNLLLIMSLWRVLAGMNSALPATPATLPLLVLCDVLLSRVVTVVNVHDNVAFAHIMAHVCDEVVVPPKVSDDGLSITPPAAYL